MMMVIQALVKDKDHGRDVFPNALKVQKIHTERQLDCISTGNPSTRTYISF